MPDKFRMLMIGDIVGRPGRRTVNMLVPQLRQEYAIDLVVANAENAAGGRGLTLETTQEILNAGVDILTSGNHIWVYKEIIPYLDGDLPLLRPLNYPPEVPGKGFLMRDKFMVINLMGRVFLGNFDCPFRTIDNLLNSLPNKPPIIIVDFHAEATSEKVAMGRYLDGRVSAVFGTHTHVGTIDAQILSKGTAYVTDVGMVGPVDSVIGVRPDSVIKRFLTHIPCPLPVASGDRVIFNSLLIDFDPSNGKAIKISRLDKEVG